MPTVYNDIIDYTEWSKTVRVTENCFTYSVRFKVKINPLCLEKINKKICKIYVFQTTIWGDVRGSIFDVISEIHARTPPSRTFPTFP